MKVFGVTSLVLSRTNLIQTDRQTEQRERKNEQMSAIVYHCDPCMPLPAIVYHCHSPEHWTWFQSSYICLHVLDIALGCRDQASDTAPLFES